MAAEPPPTNAADAPLDDDQLKSRARLGIVWLLVRTVVLQVAVLGGTVVLARRLDPVDFGLFGVATFAMAFFSFFGDAGLGGALIQKKQEPTQAELSSVFILQLSIATAVLLIVGFGAPLIRYVWHDLPAPAEWVFRALSLGLLLTVIRVIPHILMERKLLFGRLAAIEVVSTLGFYGGAAASAFAGLGVWSLVIGTLLQGFLSTALALALRPWKPSLIFDRELLRPIIAFGIPFQAKNLIGFINGAVTPIYAGAALGAKALGLIQWAQTTAYFPLKLVDIMGRVAFPLYSRISDDKKRFAETLGRSLQICSFGTFFFVALFLGLGQPLIHIVFTDKWMPALPFLHIFAGAISIGFIAPVAAAALDAAGRPQIVARLSLGWTALNWIVVLLTTPRWGMIGFVAGYAVHVVVGNLALIIVLLYVVPGVRVVRRLYGSVLGGCAAYAFAAYVAPHAMTLLPFIGAAVATFLIFAAVVLLVDYRGVKDAIALVPKKSDPVEES